MAKNHPPEDDCCPLCFDSFQFPCQTNCGHWYCGSCFVRYWRNSSEDMKYCNCPICRCLVNNLTPYCSRWFRPLTTIFIATYNYQYVFQYLSQYMTRYFPKMLTPLYERLRERWSPPEDDEITRFGLILRVFMDVLCVFALLISMSRNGIISPWLAEMLLVIPYPLRVVCVMCVPLMICFPCDKRFRLRQREWAEAQAMFDDYD